ncbi:hypothetical protein E2C01_090019 [Portunus trituberculatus]|uniref:Uncharacterized protein n=1 Tax=Portunus trituberculatus TaxID=210409 RepID=A0A5B7JKB6_PORTR|nr:hypothetical protein [Portunus trituberculatus]
MSGQQCHVRCNTTPITPPDMPDNRVFLGSRPCPAFSGAIVHFLAPIPIVPVGAPQSCMCESSIRDSRDFSPYLSSAAWADEDKTSSSALSEADVEGLAVAGSARFNGLKKENIEERPAAAGSAQGRHV